MDWLTGLVENNVLATVFTAVLGFIGMKFGKLWRYLPQILMHTKYLKSLIIAFVAFINAVKDKKVTPDEVKDVKAKIGDVVDDIAEAFHKDNAKYGGSVPE